MFNIVEMFGTKVIEGKIGEYGLRFCYEGNNPFMIVKRENNVVYREKFEECKRTLRNLMEIAQQIDRAAIIEKAQNIEKGNLEIWKTEHWFFEW